MLGNHGEALLCSQRKMVFHLFYLSQDSFGIDQKVAARFCQANTGFGAMEQLNVQFLSTSLMALERLGCVTYSSLALD